MRSAGNPDQLRSGLRSALSGALDGPVAQVQREIAQMPPTRTVAERWSRCSHADLPRPLPNCSSGSSPPSHASEGAPQSATSARVGHP
jgi:hypothetical protein